MLFRSVELILAKADVRIRKQTHANSVREQGILPLFSSFSTYLEFFFIPSLSLHFFLYSSVPLLHAFNFSSPPSVTLFYFYTFLFPSLHAFTPFLSILYLSLHFIFYPLLHCLSVCLSVCLLSISIFCSVLLFSYLPLSLLSSVFLVSVRISLFLLSCPRSPSRFLFFLFFFCLYFLYYS